MDQSILIKSLESRLKECEMKIEAVLKAIGLECQYTPEKYELVKPEQGEDE